MRILLIDDDALLRMALGRMLQHRGHQVVEFADGEDALSAVTADPQPFDCVLLDRRLLGLSGPAVLRRLRVIWPDVPVVGMTGGAETDWTDEEADQRPEMVLQKPFTVEGLLEGLHRFKPPAQEST